jgi:hypothetical protein
MPWEAEELPEYPNDGGPTRRRGPVEASPGPKDFTPPRSRPCPTRRQPRHRRPKANAQQHGRPTVMDYPDNLTGVMTDEPTKGEGSDATY